MRAPAFRIDLKALYGLGFVLATGLVLRLALLAGPQTELEADEAIVGLMARHILQGERPAFYYMQPYLGSLEAYLAAGSFALLGSSTLALKMVPLAFALLFIGLIYATGYQLAGLAAAVVAGLYVAVPPAFLALWSLKARGGYIETLVLGQALILIAMGSARRGHLGPGVGMLLGFLSGLGLWVNPLIAVYLLAVALYLILALRQKLFGWWIVTAVAGALLGALPLIDYNLHHGFATAEAMLGGTGGISEAPEYLRRFFRYSLPILAGMAQASSSQLLFWPSFWSGPAGWAAAAWALALLFCSLILAQTPRLLALLRGSFGGADGRSLLALLLMVVPAAFAVSKFRELVTEPRYLLPLYSGVPLMAAALVLDRPALWRRLAPLLVAFLFGLNLYSLVTLNPLLNLPDTAVGSVASNRQQLADFLLSRGLDRVYADYWIAYPLAFESQEAIATSVVSGGFNRYLPYAQLVSTAPNPAFVFVAGSREEGDFLRRLADRQVEAKKDTVSIYSVYSEATPLDRARP